MGRFQGHMDHFPGHLEDFQGHLEDFQGHFERFQGQLENCWVNLQHLVEKGAGSGQWAGISGPGPEENGNVSPKEAVPVMG